MSAQQINEKKLARAIRKIKHCLALSQSANENEAATALRQAQALMRDYRLTEMDVKLSDIGEIESQFGRSERRPMWDRQLSGAVAEMFGCTALSQRHWCETKGRIIERACFVGVNPAQHIALYAYETLLAKLTLARKQYVSGVRSGKHRSSCSADTAGDHFALAWVGQVYGKLLVLVPQGEEDVALENNDRNLVALEAKDKTLIAEYLADKGVGKARKARKTKQDIAAQIAGMLAGSRVELNAGITAAGNDFLQLVASA